MSNVRLLKMAHEPEAITESWLSVGAVAHWSWARIFTKPGLVVVIACCIAASVFHAGLLGKPWSAMLLPISTVVLAVLYVATVIAAIIGDAFAEWAIQKLFKTPNPKSVLHQALHILLSSIGFILGAVLVTAGDSGSHHFGRP
jgi:hypothetical protein